MLSWKIENVTFDFRAKTTWFQPGLCAWRSVIIFPSRMSARQFGEMRFGVPENRSWFNHDQKFLPPLSQSSKIDYRA